MWTTPSAPSERSNHDRLDRASAKAKRRCRGPPGLLVTPGRRRFHLTWPAASPTRALRSGAIGPHLVYEAPCRRVGVGERAQRRSPPPPQRRTTSPAKLAEGFAAVPTSITTTRRQGASGFFHPLSEPRSPAAQASSSTGPAARRKPRLLLALRVRCAAVTPDAGGSARLAPPRAVRSTTAPARRASSAQTGGTRAGEDPLPPHRPAHRSTPVTGPPPPPGHQAHGRGCPPAGRVQGGGVQAGAGRAALGAPTRRQGIFSATRVGASRPGAARPRTGGPRRPTPPRTARALRPERLSSNPADESGLRPTRSDESGFRPTRCRLARRAATPARCADIEA